MIKEGTPTFIKWAGGKTQLIDQYKSLFPKSFNNYFEPFVGSGAVFFYIKQKFNPKNITISDINEDLIDTYNAVKEDLGVLNELLKKHKKNHSEEYFYKMREEFNTTKDKLKKAALFIYLNKTCFNGLYRVNSTGEFNVPFGKYKNPGILQNKKLNEASKTLKEVKINCVSFEKVADFAKEGDFIYFDPPYYPINNTSSFTSYQKSGFLEKEQKKLAEVFKRLDKKGCKVMLSNSDTNFIKGLYKDYDIKTVKARRAINCNGNGRGIINEIVVRNY